MQRITFETEVRIITLGAGCDMVFGVDCLNKFSPIIFYFQRTQLSFTKDGKMVTLAGVQEEATSNL